MPELVNKILEKKLYLFIFLAIVAGLAVSMFFLLYHEDGPRESLIVSAPESGRPPFYESFYQSDQNKPQPSVFPVPLQDFGETVDRVKEQINQEFFQTSSQPAAKTEDYVKKLSDEEYFREFYPQTYIVYLDTLQEAMLKDAFIDESEKTVFKTEEDTFKLFFRFIDYLAVKGQINEEQKKNFKEGVDVALRGFNKMERLMVEQTILERRSALREFLEHIFGVLMSEAYACGINTGYPDCYVGITQGAGEYGEVTDTQTDLQFGEYGEVLNMGFNGWSYCCNCGLWCGYGCTYVYDCGPSGAACNSGWYGCLNGICQYGNAIWDQMSGICGCG